MSDKTKHDKNKPHTPTHDDKIIQHGPEWYAFWGNKCPVCGVDAESTND